MDRWRVFTELKTRHEAVSADKDAFIQHLLEQIDQLLSEQQRVSDDLDQAKYLNRNYQADLRKLRDDNERLKNQVDVNPFVLVLIDGDNAQFQDTFTSAGRTGGEEAARELFTSITGYLTTLPEYEPHWQLVIRVYAKQSGLSRTYVNVGIIPDLNHYYSFVSGFNAVYELCDYIDAGNDKEGADADIKKNFELFSRNMHCKHIMLAISGDNSYAGSLRRFEDGNWFDRITFIEALPFTPDLKRISSKFLVHSFNSIFRGTKLIVPSKEVRAEVRTEPRADKPVSFASVASTPSLATLNLNSPATSKVNDKPIVAAPNPVDNRRTVEISWNKQGCRVDRILGPYDPEVFRQLKLRKLCNRHFLTKCIDDYCNYEHNGKLTQSQLLTLRHLARLTACNTPYCDDPLCTNGHRCINGAKCSRGPACKFSREMHDFDTEVHEKEKYVIGE